MVYIVHIIMINLWKLMVILYKSLVIIIILYKKLVNNGVIIQIHAIGN